MAKINQLEYQIQSALQQKAETIQVPQDLFARIHKELPIGPTICRQSKLGLICWRVAIIAISVIVITGMILVPFSREAMVMAAQVVDSIKTIFIVEKKDGHYRTVIKPVGEFKLSQGVCKKLSGVDDFSLGQKVGFKVVFPDTLAGYRLEFKAIGAKLDRKLDVDTFSQLGDRIQKALDDDQALKSLKVYDAHRYAGACYRKDNTIIGMYVMDRAYHITHNVIKKVTFQNCGGFWLEHPRNQYFKDKNTEVKNLQVRHSLFWVKNGHGFYLRSEGETDLTYQEAIRIADLFSKAY
ncbi:hypothetical protein EDC14_10264 [Hydrogenispora ethanolica]|jgi:hypothetical protein|uniref:DUF4367 domain-containing protein n=1 Tax=Hydrogenispora ethanolica TaxID=1082276 RepID=A0A4R1R985_HYDET|nr:hypothetical protein [Hydrogenispora ethanolica]TCL62261.1 hypothetical protein EDC14_10264 [Hydrogenispora ethanolica]